MIAAGVLASSVHQQSEGLIACMYLLLASQNFWACPLALSFLHIAADLVFRKEAAHVQVNKLKLLKDCFLPFRFVCIWWGCFSSVQPYIQDTGTALSTICFSLHGIFVRESFRLSRVTIPVMIYCVYIAIIKVTPLEQGKTSIAALHFFQLFRSSTVFSLLIRRPCQKQCNVFFFCLGSSCWFRAPGVSGEQISSSSFDSADYSTGLQYRYLHFSKYGFNCRTGVTINEAMALAYGSWNSTVNKDIPWGMKVLHCIPCRVAFNIPTVRALVAWFETG